jgi:HTH-type transcriptional regulator / antitoxin HigA
MNVKPIRTDAEYKQALARASAFFELQPALGSPDADTFEMLLLVIDTYENEHYPIDPPSPIDAIKFRMDQAGLTPKDLVPMIGPLNRVYEVLAGTRTLTIPMIRRLHQGLGISADVLIGQDPQKAARAD